MAITKVTRTLLSTGIDDQSNATAITIDSSENVGIGQTSPIRPIHLSTSSGGSIIHLTDDSTGHTATDGVDIQQEGTLFQILNREAGDIRFGTNATERMRIDSSGNLLVGTTDDVAHVTSSSGEGIALSAGSYGGFIGATRNQDVVMQLNRTGNDGDIVKFAKDGSIVGSIGTVDGDIYVGTGDTGLFFSDANNEIRPYNTSTQNSVDAAIDLGRSASRFKDLYLSGNVRVDAGQGIFFGGAAGASGMTSQVLDDYEEGTFTPTCSALGTTVFSAKYTKVGDLVTLVVYIETTTAGSGTSGNATFTGLPFTSQGNGWSVGALSIAASNTSVNGNPLHVRVVANSSNIDLKKNNDTIMLGSEIDAGHIIWTVSYKAA